MTGRRSARKTHPPVPPQPVPATEAVRQAALQASWRRDRQVSRRRVLWRWTLWYSRLYFPHASVALLIIGATLFLASKLFWPRGDGHAVAPPAVATPTAIVPDAVSTTPIRTGAADLDQGSSPEEAPLVLRASTAWDPLPRSAQEVAAPAASTDTLSLKPENWLHSKEP